MTPLWRFCWTSEIGCITGLAPNASTKGISIRDDTRSLSPCMSSSRRTGRSRVISRGGGADQIASTLARYSRSSTGRARCSAAVQSIALSQTPGYTLSMVLGNVADVYPGRVATMSATPSSSRE